MSVPALRPSRVTTNYGLPIPGDAGPADYVTDTGSLADAVDIALLGQRAVPLIVPSQLSQITSPHDGQLVDMMVDSTIGIIWRLRYTASITADDCRWAFVGGSPLQSFDTTFSGAFPANAWQRLPPTIALPRQGFYTIEQKATATATGANYVALGAREPSNTISIYAEFSDSQILIPAANNQATLHVMGRSILMTANQIDTGGLSTGAGGSIGHRGLSVTPIRVR